VAARCWRSADGRERVGDERASSGWGAALVAERAGSPSQRLDEQNAGIGRVILDLDNGDHNHQPSGSGAHRVARADLDREHGVFGGQLLQVEQSVSVRAFVQAASSTPSRLALAMTSASGGECATEIPRLARATPIGRRCKNRHFLGVSVISDDDALQADRDALERYWHAVELADGIRAAWEEAGKPLIVCWPNGTE
jgi:hypothetical protein